ncbi:hypothetical protein GGR57DRAFT_514182 [Xylariaceae sp. FL1272]|nr:hypothetical protein GGR57DRAFT_514182 [Xylariaceae sp. FL1272]
MSTQARNPRTNPNAHAHANANANTNYKGSTVKDAENNAIPEDQNCAVFITQIPRGSTYRDLVASMTGRGIGRIKHAQFLEHNANYVRMAAKVVFFHPQSVARLLAVNGNGQIQIRNRRPHIVRNIHRVPPSEPRPVIPGNHGRVSRVLEVTGPQEVVDLRILWQLVADAGRFAGTAGDEVRGAPDGVNRVVILHLCSYEEQLLPVVHLIKSQATNMAITAGERELWSRVVCAFGVDPCA